MNKTFIVEMLKKYIRHLRSVEKSIDTNLNNYDFQLKNLKNLDEKKYKEYKQELEYKRSEAFIKLNNIVPNIEKMEEQILELEK